MRLGELLKRYRQYRDITVRELAKEIRISAPTISRIERGNDCDSHTLIQILIWMAQPKAEAK